MIARVGCVVLAAGESRRLGGALNKLVLPLSGRPIVQRAIDLASQSHALTCTLVVGADAERVLAAVDVRRCAVVENREWKEGIASSIRAGLAQHRGDEACVFIVGDQPYVELDDVNGLIAHHLADREAIVALHAGDVWGTPMLFPRADFSALAALRGDQGAKRYALAQKRRLRFVKARSRHAFADVDTNADYDSIRQIDPRT